MDTWWVGQDDEDSFGRPMWGLEDMVLLQDHRLAVAVPYFAHEDLRDRVFAAMKTYELGNKSVDCVLRRYGDLWDLPELEPDMRRLFERTRPVRPMVVDVVRRMYARAADLEMPLGQLAAGMSLVRLQNTFQAALLLVRQGLHFEAFALQRMILEQLAWAVAIHEDESESIFDVRPHKSIPSLKALFPLVGKLYGELSETAHIMPDTTLRYVSRAEDGQLFVHHRQRGLAWADAVRLLLLVHVFAVVAEYITRTNPVDLHAIELDVARDVWTLRVDEPAFVAAQALEAELAAL
ncbi:MAG: hypothetical protein JWN67_4145 [Actinomycetia bacterium]|nr:hypothetical protein [Actinomycetes bacterium]